MVDDTDRFDDQEKRFAASMVTGMVLMVAAMLLPGFLAIGAGIAGGSLLGVALWTFLHADQADNVIQPRGRVGHQRIEQCAEPQPAISLAADTPPSAGFWLERVERNAETTATERRR